LEFGWVDGFPGGNGWVDDKNWMIKMDDKTGMDEKQNGGWIPSEFG
jgi:hypothetical protein